MSVNVTVGAGSAKGADARRQPTKELADSPGGALNTRPVLRLFLGSSALPANWSKLLRDRFTAAARCSP